MDSLVKTFFGSITSDGGGDFVDRLNYRYTVMMLIVGAATISAKQYVGQPIQCWVPAQFTKAMEQYTENYCWVQNTYWISWKSSIPDEHNERLKSQISYYQWVPFILLGQAAMFYLPFLFWKIMRLISGLNLETVRQMATEIQNSDVRLKDRVLTNLASYVESSLFHLRRTGSKKYSKIRWLHWYRIYSPLYSYIFTKVLYLINASGQLFLLNVILSNPSDYMYGLTLLDNLIRGIDWQSSGAFPRTTLCDFDVRVLGNVHRYTVQCVLMINMLNEKLFIFIWFWLLFVAVTTLVDIFYSTWCLLAPFARKIFIRSLLLDDRFQKIPYPAPLFKLFVETHLGANGILILKLIESQVGVVTASHVTIEMWYNFLNQVDSRLVERTRIPNFEVYEDDSNLVKRINTKFGFVGSET